MTAEDDRNVPQARRADTQDDRDEDEGSVQWEDVSHVAHLTGKTPRTVRRWCKQGKVDARKRGGSWEIRLSSLSGDRPGSGQLGPSEASGDTTQSDRERSELQEKVVEQAQYIGRLEERIQQRLPSGKEESQKDRMERVLIKISSMPFLRWVVPRDLRRELTGEEAE